MREPQSETNHALQDLLEGDAAKAAPEAGAIRRAARAMEQDIRFEYLKEDQIRNLVREFVETYQVQEGKTVQGFVEEHARKVISTNCFVEIEHLTISAEIEIAGVRFIPPSNAPRPVLFGHPIEIVGVGVAPTQGTDFQKMVDRAKIKVAAALRVLRAALRDQFSLHENQLRFQLGEHAWLEDTQAGWQRHPDDPFGLELTEELANFVASQEISKLNGTSTTDAEDRIYLALRWLDRAQLELDPTTRVLFGFFALESILGNTAERLKGLALAHRRAMLAVAVTESFASPHRTFYLYDSIRSKAVHGEGVPSISEKEARNFIWDVRRAITEFLVFSQRDQLTSRKAIRRALANHPDNPRMRDHLMDENLEIWKQHFERDKPRRCPCPTETHDSTEELRPDEG